MPTSESVARQQINQLLAASDRAVEAAVEAGVKRAARLRQAVLRSAFEGKLT